MQHKKRFHSTLLIIRIIVGIIFFAHGMQKFNMGMDAVSEFFGGVGIPLSGLMAWVITLLETFGGIALIIGVGTRLVALLLGITMIVATIVVKWKFGLISVGNGAGYELDLALFAALLPLITLGAGRFTVPALMMRRSQEASEMPRQSI